MNFTIIRCALDFQVVKIKGYKRKFTEAEIVEVSAMVIYHKNLKMNKIENSSLNYKSLPQKK